MAPGPRQVSWVSNQGGLGAWQYCRAFLKAPSVKGMVLEDMEVVRDKPEATLGMGPLVASTEGASPFTAGKVWKIKNFQTPKPDSTYWTGSTFYEYGFASTPALRLPMSSREVRGRKTGLQWKSKEADRASRILPG